MIPLAAQILQRTHIPESSWLQFKCSVTYIAEGKIIILSFINLSQNNE